MHAAATSNSDATQREKQEAGSLPSATLLAATGGALDAFIYLNHGTSLRRR